MSRLVETMERHAAVVPQQVALAGSNRAWTYAEAVIEVDRLVGLLSAAGPRTIGLLADNGAAWALADLAAYAAGIPVVPIPAFFTPSQVRHVVSSAGVDCVLTDDVARVASTIGLDVPIAEPFSGELSMLRLPRASDVPLRSDIRKITFTSGTTGTPKGVCLTDVQIESVARSMMDASGARPTDRHLCLMPLATLLENVAGIYVPLMAGATSCIPALAEVGLRGSSGFDVVQAISALSAWRATTALTVPQTLNGLVTASRAGIALPRELRYLAVGGAPVSVHALEAAGRCGLPVYEGYGLSECGSVVAVNRPDAHRMGSVGKPLPHLDVQIARDGEILVRGPRSGGYLDGTTRVQETPLLATGDLGYLDDDGYLYVTGRKRDVFITSFGRNVAPEWIERELVLHPQILQALVIGEGRPYNSAVIVVASQATPSAVDLAIDAVNECLPDYARVIAWTIADEPFSPANGLSTFNGRLRRDNILRSYAKKLDSLYQPSRRDRRVRTVPRPVGERHA